MKGLIILMFCFCLQMGFNSYKLHSPIDAVYEYRDSIHLLKENFLETDIANMQVYGFFGEMIHSNLTKRLLAVNEQQLLDGFGNSPRVQDWIGEQVVKKIIRD